MSDDVKQVMDNVHKLITVSINMIKNYKDSFQDET